MFSKGFKKPVAHLFFFCCFFFNLTQYWADGRLRNFIGPKASYCHTPSLWFPTYISEMKSPHIPLYTMTEVDSTSKGKTHLATQPLRPILRCTLERYVDT